VRRNDDPDSEDVGNLKGETRSNDPHEKSDPDLRPNRKGKTASELRYMGHALSDNRHGPMVSAGVSLADGYAEREAAKVAMDDARHALGDSTHEITLWQTEAMDAAEFIEASKAMITTLNVAQKKSGRQSAVPEAIVRSEAMRCHSKGQAHRTGFWLGKERQRDAPGVGARLEEGRSDARADGGLIRRLNRLMRLRDAIRRSGRSYARLVHCAI
jgi:hypothetical protein